MGRPWVRILAWWAFWLLVYWLGMQQAWVFSDIPPEPVLVRIIGPTGLWATMIYMFGPILQLKIQASWLAPTAWALLVAASTVAVERALFPRRRYGWIALIVTVGGQVVLRLLAIVLPEQGGMFVYIASSLLLTAVVAIAWLCLILFPIVFAIPRLRRNVMGPAAN